MLSDLSTVFIKAMQDWMSISALLGPFGCAAHGQREGQSPEEVGRSQGVAALALGSAGQRVGDFVGFRPADSHGDDAVVRQPAVVHRVPVAPAEQVRAEDALVVHVADHPVFPLFFPQGFLGVYLRRGGLVDAVLGRKHIVVVAQREVLYLVHGGLLGPAQPGGAVGLVADQHLCSCFRCSKRLGYPVAALVGAEDDADTLIFLSITDPPGDFLRVGGDPPLDFVGADVAGVGGHFLEGVSLPFLLRVITGGLVRAHGQGTDPVSAVQQVFAPYLRHQGDGRAQHHGQPARRRQFLDYAQGDAGLAGAAGQDDLAASLADGDAVQVGCKLTSQPAHSGADGVVLHAGPGLPSPLAIRVGPAVGALLVSDAPLRLRRKVGVEVDVLDLFTQLGIGPFSPVAESAVPIGDQPPLGV